VLSAWDAGTASAGLRPRPTAAMIVVSVDRPEREVVRYDMPQIEKLVSAHRRDELFAAGILFLLLLVGLPAPIPALIASAVGAISMLCGFGEVALLGHVLSLDHVGVALGTMTGLALGVGFALLILDRFHSEGATALEPSTGRS
jgi:hypothetical protein